MTKSFSEFVDFRLLRFVILILTTSLVASFIPIVAPIIIVALVLLLNAIYFKGKIFTLYLAFIFLDSYSLVWGGDLLIVNLPEETIDIVFTKASKYIGYILVLLVIGKKRFIKRLNFLDALVTLFFLLMLASPVTAAFGAEEPIKMIPRVIQFFMLYILTRIIVSSKNDIHRFFQFIIISFVPVFIVICLQYLSGYFGSGYGNGRPGELTRFLPYLLTLSTLFKNRRGLFLVIIPMSIFLSFYHGSRRFLIEIAGYLSLHFKVSKATIILVGFLFISGPLLYELIPDTTRSRIEFTIRSLNEIKNGNTSDEVLDRLGTGRWSLLQAGMSMWLQAPIFGVGLKNNVKYMPDYGGKHRAARIHNYYAEVLVDLGIVGLVLLILLIVEGFRLLRHIQNQFFNQDVFLTSMVKAYRYQFIMLHFVAFFGNSMFGTKGVWITYALIGSLSTLASSRENSTVLKMKF